MAELYMLAGGGTGGHVFPLLAVAQALRAERKSVEIVFVGTARGMETRILGKLGERLELLDILPIKGGGLRGGLRGGARAALALPASYKLVRRLRPRAVLSIGGYAAGPVSIAARAMGIPLALLEPNRVLGLANHLTAPFVQRAYLAFPETAARFRTSVVRLHGVPLRNGFEPRDYAPTEGEMRVLVIGGSLGAITLNKNVPAAIGLARKNLSTRITVTHQSGNDRMPEVEEQYRAANAMDDITIVPFIDDVPSALAKADIVIQRAGASAAAEVCAVGRPSILIPYPFAAGDHQLHNARALEAAHASLCISSSDASPQRISEELRRLAKNPDERVRMAQAAKKHGHPEAARQIARDLIKLAEAT